MIQLYIYRIERADEHCQVASERGTEQTDKQSNRDNKAGGQNKLTKTTLFVFCHQGKGHMATYWLLGNMEESCGNAVNHCEVMNLNVPDLPTQVIFADDD